MKTKAKLISLAILCALALSSFSTLKQDQTHEIKTFSVNEVFNKVYNAVQQVLSESKSTTLKLESIDLAFETTTTTDATFGVKLWVVSGEYKRSKSDTKKVNFSFGEDEKVTKSLIEDKSIKVFKEYLAAVIKGSEDIKDINNFGLKEIEVEVDFTITRSGGIGAEIELSPVTPSTSINRETEAVHSITLKFKKK